MGNNIQFLYIKYKENIYQKEREPRNENIFPYLDHLPVLRTLIPNRKFIDNAKHLLLTQ
jgi:hypothetical protein